MPELAHNNRIGGPRADARLHPSASRLRTPAFSDETLHVSVDVVLLRKVADLYPHDRRVTIHLAKPHPASTTCSRAPPPAPTTLLTSAQSLALPRRWNVGLASPARQTQVARTHVLGTPLATLQLNEAHPGGGCSSCVLAHRSGRAGFTSNAYSTITGLEGLKLKVEGPVQCVELALSSASFGGPVLFICVSEASRLKGLVHALYSSARRAQLELRVLRAWWFWPRDSLRVVTPHLVHRIPRVVLASCAWK
ncbi:hypothetical protein B0H14DRAFT_3609831 [Mycena olivaceomarginata]|nr:hypothetical protein B0H14DRAFT_3609831 [Mycena olivaceomarginata]